MSVLAANEPQLVLPAETPPSEPQQTPRPWGFASTLAWLVLACLGGIGAAALVIAAAVLGAGAELSSAMAYAEAAGLLCVAVAVLILAAAAKLARWRVRDYFAIFQPRSRDLLVGFVLVAAWTAFGSVMLYFGVGTEDAAYLVNTYVAAKAAGALALFWIAVVVAAPVAEEMVFRGFVYRGWSQSRLGVVGTIIVSALIFGLLHQQYTWVGIVDCTVFGLLAGYLRWRSGTILAPMALHALNNIVSMLYTVSIVG